MSSGRLDKGLVSGSMPFGSGNAEGTSSPGVSIIIVAVWLVLYSSIEFTRDWAWDFRVARVGGSVTSGVRDNEAERGVVAEGTGAGISTTIDLDRERFLGETEPSRDFGAAEFPEDLGTVGSFSGMGEGARDGAFA